MQLLVFNWPGCLLAPVKHTSPSWTTILDIMYKMLFFLHISSSYAKILGETNFRTREIPRSGSKAKDGERKRKRILQGLRVAQAAMTERWP